MRFADLTPGIVIRTQPRIVTAKEIVEFASRYDPQAFHLDVTAGKEHKVFGGLVASGALWGVYQFLHTRGRGSLVSAVLALDFLKLQDVAFLVLLGGAAGLFGAIASLRREAL